MIRRDTSYINNGRVLYIIHNQRRLRVVISDCHRRCYNIPLRCQEIKRKIALITGYTHKRAYIKTPIEIGLIINRRSSRVYIPHTRYVHVILMTNYVADNQRGYFESCAHFTPVYIIAFPCANIANTHTHIHTVNFCNCERATRALVYIISACDDER